MTDSPDPHVDEQWQDKHLPTGFEPWSPQMVLAFVVFGMIFGFSMGQAGALGEYVFMGFILILVVAGIVNRRSMRRYLKQHGDVEVWTRFSLAKDQPKKRLLFRDVAEIIDDALERVLDGKKDETPESSDSPDEPESPDNAP